MDRVRVQERLVLKLCVEQAKMPKKNFVKLFTGNETNLDWFNTEKSLSKPYAEGLRMVEDDVIVVVPSLLQLKKKPSLASKTSTVVCQSVKLKLAVRKRNG